MTADEARQIAKVKDVLEIAVRHHRARDEMNAALHLATTPRYSPLTVELETALETVTMLRAT